MWQLSTQAHEHFNENTNILLTGAQSTSMCGSEGPCLLAFSNTLTSYLETCLRLYSLKKKAHVCNSWNPVTLSLPRGNSPSSTAGKTPQRWKAFHWEYGAMQHNEWRESQQSRVGNTTLLHAISSFHWHTPARLPWNCEKKEKKKTTDRMHVWDLLTGRVCYSTTG